MGCPPGLVAPQAKFFRDLHVTPQETPKITRDQGPALNMGSQSGPHEIILGVGPLRPKREQDRDIVLDGRRRLLRAVRLRTPDELELLTAGRAAGMGPPTPPTTAATPRVETTTRSNRCTALTAALRL